MPQEQSLQKLINHVVKGVKEYMESIGQSEAFKALKSVVMRETDEDL
jgi:hypothetical protein